MSGDSADAGPLGGAPNRYPASTAHPATLDSAFTVVLAAETDGRHYPVLVARGAIEGADLYRFGEDLERLAKTTARTLHLDVAQVESWSLIAQAMVLSTARRIAHRGGRLVLHSPSQSLRDDSRLMNVFGRVTTERNEMTTGPRR